MSDLVRLTLVSHAMTDAMSAGRFPADEPLSALGHRQADAAADPRPVDAAYCGPEQRTRQTAHLLGLSADVEPRLADLDCGRWGGAALAGVPPDQLQLWLSDSTSAPHGGESVAELIHRVGGWMAALARRRGRVVAVTHPSVVRAAILVALEAPAQSFWRIDVAPASRTVMHCRGQTWMLRWAR